MQGKGQLTTAKGHLTLRAMLYLSASTLWLHKLDKAKASSEAMQAHANCLSTAVIYLTTGCNTSLSVWL